MRFKIILDYFLRDLVFRRLEDFRILLLAR
nr:MAG TPA: hypothetical protein [Caudoviricetes sp.]